ncbi:MAG: hypothetical protein JXA93_17510 [Anaerolineae bacterium]|nr:hypothetical protein [Anaerolineae bacterium]
MIYPTAEVRWFWPGEIPPAVLGWLAGWPVPSESQPARVDYYARLPAGMRETASMKLREGRLEVKWRHEECGLVRLAPDVLGALEFWRKRIFLSSEAGDARVTSLAVGADSIAVEKVRRLARFWVADDGQVMVVALPELGPSACEFEVTTVQAMEQVWWTACFEAVGAAEAVLEATLLRVAAHVLAEPHPLTLSAEYSLSYPQWLARLG